MKNKALERTCIKPISGFTVGENYKIISQYGKYVEVIDNSGNREILLDIYFSNLGKKE